MIGVTFSQETLKCPKSFLLRCLQNPCAAITISGSGDTSILLSKSIETNDHPDDDDDWSKGSICSV